MATNKFLIFDEAGQDLMTDVEYQSASQRVSGVIPGLAEAKMHNKLYRQVSIMAAAIGKVLAESNLDAPDDSLNILAANIKELFVSKPLDAHPVGSIYISVSSVSPADIFGGTWEKIQGRFLLAASDAYAAGSTGGEANHVLTANEMPSHAHSITVNSNGAHTHTASSNSTGAHTHTRGTMNITGTFPQCDDLYESAARGQVTGAFYWNDGQMQGTAPGDFDEGSYRIAFDAARTWSGVTSSAGSHSHTVTVNSAGAHTHTASAANTGGGKAHNNMPPYLAVHVWQRIA